MQSNAPQNAEIRMAEFLAAGKVDEAIFWPALGTKERT